MSELYWRVNRRDVALSFGLILALLLAFFLNPETIPAGNGFGYDGVMYARMVAEIDQMISSGQLSTYYSQRILPSLLVRMGLQSLGLPLDSFRVIWGFRALNVGLLLLSLPLWFAIAQRLKVSRAGYWLGIAGLFLAFPNAKQLFYYPVLTDTFAFAIGLALLWSYLAGRPALIALFSIVGAFAWQLAGLIGLLLVVSSLLRIDPESKPKAGLVRRPSGYATGLVFLGVACAAALVALLYPADADIGPATVEATTPPETLKLVLTNLPILALAVIFLARICVLSWSGVWRPMLTRKRVVHVALLVVAMLFVPKVVLGVISNDSIPPPGISGYGDTLEALLYLRVREGLFLLPVIAHSVYYGPIFILFVILWRKVAETAIELGPGFAVAISLFVVLSVFSESRFSFMLWPFAVAAVVKAFSASHVTRLMTGLVVITAVAYSKAWYRINQGEWQPPDHLALDQWPKSAYFSHLGPWMSVEHYTAQCLVVGTLFFLFAVALRNASGEKVEGYDN